MIAIFDGSTKLFKPIIKLRFLKNASRKRIFNYLQFITKRTSNQRHVSIHREVLFNYWNYNFRNNNKGDVTDESKANGTKPRSRRKGRTEEHSFPLALEDFQYF